MGDLVKVLDREVERVEYKGRAVVTLRQVDELHERPEGTAYRNFNANKARFQPGEDYWELPYEEGSEILNLRNSSVQKGGKRDKMLFLSLSGYLLLVKSFSDDRSWKVQKRLVDAYFTLQGVESATIAGNDGVALSKERYIELLEAENGFLRRGPATGNVAFPQGLQEPQVKSGKRAPTRVTNLRHTVLYRKMLERYPTLERFRRETGIPVSREVLRRAIYLGTPVTPRMLYLILKNLAFDKEEIKAMLSEAGAERFIKDFLE